MADREYAFDIKLQAVARVRAASEDAARAAIRAELECLDVGCEVKAQNGATITLTEASICGTSGYLFEVDGEEVDGDAGEDECATCADATETRLLPCNECGAMDGGEEP
jgi:hypothetical protein